MILGSLLPIMAASNQEDEDQADEGISLYSDTTSQGLSTLNSQSNNNASRGCISLDMNNPIQMLMDLATIGGAIALIALLIFAIPLILIIVLVIYLLRCRQKKEKAVLHALENGQQISTELLPEVFMPNELLWRKGLRNIFLGLGIAVFAFIINFKILLGIGLFIAIYGAWQAIAAKTTKTPNKEEEKQ